jgi:hypothetical protein
LILLVIPCVVRLREVSARQKTVLGGVLSLGVFGIVVGVVRVVVSLGAGGGEGVGVAGITQGFFVLTVLELDVAVVCASVPTLRPVLARVWPRLGVVGELGDRRGGEGSVDLTSVVSYHGYPWTRNATPVGTPRVGSKNPSVLDLGALAGRGDVPPVPPPPPPVLAMTMHRAPTTLSLRSFMSGMAPRSRGRMEGEDKTGLLGDESQGGDGLASRRRSSAGIEAYYEQFAGHSDLEKWRSRCGARTEARLSRGSRCYSARWGDSQESFVMGVNDPQSPKRLSPVSGLSEMAKAELRRRGSEDEGEVG